MGLIYIYIFLWQVCFILGVILDKNFLALQCVIIPNVYVHVNSTLMGRSNHLICPLGSCHASPAALLVPPLELPT